VTPLTKAAEPADITEESSYIALTASPSRHADTRYLSRFELLLNGLQPLPLSSNLRDDNSVLTVDLTNPDIYFDQHLTLPKDTIHLVRTLFLWRGSAYHRLGIQNHGEAHIKINLSLSFDNDFADLFEVRGLHRNRRGKVETHSSADRAMINTEVSTASNAAARSLSTRRPPICRRTLRPIRLICNLVSVAPSISPSNMRLKRGSRRPFSTA
jgi:glycogen debranching enzyme